MRSNERRKPKLKSHAASWEESRIGPERSKAALLALARGLNHATLSRIGKLSRPVLADRASGLPAGMEMMMSRAGRWSEPDIRSAGLEASRGHGRWAHGAVAPRKGQAELSTRTRAGSRVPPPSQFLLRLLRPEIRSTSSRGFTGGKLPRQATC
jgi:hypothetical protein